MSIPAGQVGKALHTVAETMRSQPLAFGFVITNILWIAFFIWFAWTLRDRNTTERQYFQAILERCQPEIFKPGG